MRKPWLLAALGLAAFALLAWFAGPLLTVGGVAPLATPQARVLLAIVFSGQYLVQKWWSARRARRNNERVVSVLAPSQAASAAPASESAVLRERFASALHTLRHARFGTPGGFWSSLSWKFGRQYLYQLPWYMIIGAPGAGKTTALLNSGLNFPLADSMGRGAVRGVGGTRNCDWWFTDRAVLIDTAGRYTTHESDRIADRQAWESFLGLLRDARPRQPLNGILVAVSLSDLLSFSAGQLAEHADTLRARLDELQSTLGMRIPVYVVVTKCDLMVGFVDWFFELERRERDQVWGVTFADASSNDASAADEFAVSFDRLTDRLTDGLVDRLQLERDPQRRARIFALPRQCRGLREPLDELVRRVFGLRPQQSRSSGACLRGVYLTSGTQEGTPIDRMLSAFGRELGLSRQILPPNQASGKSFFLGRLLNEVVFAEAELAGRAPSSRRWRRSLIIASMATVQLAAVVLAAYWVTGHAHAVDRIAGVGAETARARAAVDAMPASVGLDPRPLLPALDAVRQLAVAAESPGPQPSHQQAAVRTLLLGLGERPQRKLAAAARQAYERMLLGSMLRQLAQGTEALMRTGADVNLQYEALKMYSMLNDASHFDAEAFKAFVIFDWESASDPPLTSVQRSDLVDHLDALIAAGAVGSGTAGDAALVDSVRARLNGQSPPQRVATRLRAHLGSLPYPDFTVASAGPAAVDLFVGADGRSAPRSVAGRYTLDAYRGAVAAAIPAIVAQLASEAPWVLGSAAAGRAAAAEALASDRSASEALASYRADYAVAWSDFVDDLRLKHATGNAEAIRQAQLLGARDGPLASLLRQIARQTNLPAAATDGDRPAGQPVSERFGALAQFVSEPAGIRSSLDSALNSFSELQVIRALAAQGMDSAAVAAVSPDRLDRIRAEARRDPEPVRAMLLALAVIPPPSVGSAPGRESVAGAGTSALSRQIAARIGALCSGSVPGRFPFDRGADREIALGEFSQLFAPSGAFDQVFGQLLAPHVDTRTEPWSVRDRTAGLEPAELERFRSAARIRDAFFAGGRRQPALRLTFRPLDMDESIDRFQLEIDGQKVRYAHGPQTTTVVNWPGSSGGARIEMTPAADGVTPPAYSGPWAMFRLLDKAAVAPSATAGRYRIVFNVGGRRASFEVESDGGFNPFRLPELERFECPASG